MNPYDVNPLRDIVAAQIDFDRLRTASPVKLFVAATHANTGQLRLFRTPELSADTLLASACLPTVNRAVEIDGEPYWDGGYSANPAVLPLLQECRAHDMLLVLLSPLRHKGTPGTLEEIRERVLEFAFTTSFLREMRILAQLRDAAAKSWMPPGRFERRVASAHFHLIDAEDVMSDLTAETKLAANMKFFVRLRDLGRARAQAWLHEHFAGVGQRSSVDIGRLFG
jgi:NTE family protein